MGGVRHCSVDLDGPVHYADFGGSGRPIVLVHGLGGSHVNWLSVGEALSRHGRVVAPDLVGHGLTQSLGRSASVGKNQQLLGRFLAAVAGEPAVLVGNSMGGYLSIAEAAAEPERVAGLVLVDPAVPLVLGAGFDLEVLALFAARATPGVGGALMRRRRLGDPERAVRGLLSLCCVDAGRIAADVVAAHVELTRVRHGQGAQVGRDFLEAQRSLVGALVRRGAFHRMVAAVRAPTLIVQGERDRLVRVAAVRAVAAARPDWQLEVLADLGHVPQLEAPERFLAVVEPWLRRAAALATDQPPA